MEMEPTRKLQISVSEIPGVIKRYVDGVGGRKPGLRVQAFGTAPIGMGGIVSSDYRSLAEYGIEKEMIGLWNIIAVPVSEEELEEYSGRVLELASAYRGFKSTLGALLHERVDGLGDFSLYFLALPPPITEPIARTRFRLLETELISIGDHFSTLQRVAPAAGICCMPRSDGFYLKKTHTIPEFDTVVDSALLMLSTPG